MFAPGNIKYEEIRAQEMVNALTDRKKVAILFASARSQHERNHAQAEMNGAASRNNGGLISRLVRGFRLNRSAVAETAAQNPSNANERASTSACC